MSGLLETGSNWLESQRHTHLTRAVTYRRGEDSVELRATVGRTEFDEADEYGVIHRIESRDFLVRTQDLVLSGSPTLPRDGDRIEETVNSTTYVYEVVSPDTEPPWRYSDPYRQTLRIHTKQVSAV